MNRQEWQQWRAQTLKDFEALPEDRKDKEAAEAILKHSQLHADESSGEESGVERAGKSNEAIETVLDAVGNDVSSFPAKAFERIARKVSGQKSGPAPGLSAYSSQLRAEQAQRVFVPNTGAVPKDEEFEYYLPCPLKHPGLCRKDDANILPHLRSAALAMFDGFRTFPPGTFFVIRFTESHKDPEGAEIEKSWDDYVSSAYSRGANPRMLMVCRVQSIDEGIELDRRKRVFEDEMAIEYLGSIWKLTVADDKKMVSVRAVPVIEDRSRCEDSAAFITMHGSMKMKVEADFAAGGITIFPPSAASRSQSAYTLGTTVGALRNLFQKPRAATRRPAKASKAEGSLPKVEAKPGPEIDNAGSESDLEATETDGGDGKSSEEEDMVRDLEDRRRLGPPVLEPAFERPAKRSRGSNDFEYEGRTMTRIWKNAVSGAQEIVGYSIICRCGHVDMVDPDQVCLFLYKKKGRMCVCT